MQANDAEHRIGHFPHRRDAIHHSCRLIDNHIDQPAVAFELERCGFVFSLEP
jgi:hypothetical protein